MGICSYNDLNPVCRYPSDNFELIDKRENRKGCKRKVELRDCPGNETMLPLEHSIFLTYPPELFHCKFTWNYPLTGGRLFSRGGGAGDLCAVRVQRCEGNALAIVWKILEKFSEVEHAESRLCFFQDRQMRSNVIEKSRVMGNVRMNLTLDGDVGCPELVREERSGLKNNLWPS
ncbi:Receptor-like serine/threonine-protein kinase [Forsythia ovata]|uniref:Receptor-like serine/threonine-protein kinase n=1 Tax=Forsythia ovata TaxID=205694 RepID=A0ABD1WQX1_9LAMI